MSAVAKARCCTLEPKLSAMKWPARVLAILGAVEGQAEGAVVALDRLAAHQAGGIDDVDHRRLPRPEDRGVEQEPGQHLLVVHGLSDMVDRRRGRRPSGSLVDAGSNSMSQTSAESALGR